MLFSLLCGLAIAAPPSFDFYSHGPYDNGVRRPEQVLGYEIGTQHTVFRDQERVLFSIADGAKAKVFPIEYGKSTEGRPLRVFAISSPENIRNLERIRQVNMQLASGQNNQDAIKSAPAIVWINQCIHGDETASFESAMALVYNLAASRHSRITNMLSNAVVLVNPVYNPDGHERYVVAYNSMPNGSPEPGSIEGTVPSAFFGRANHYRFDMNRDRVAMSQLETRQEVALFLKWMPQVYVDQHGQVATYFFPPVQQSVNTNVDRERYAKWSDIFGRATAKQFDQQGWQYFIRDDFDLYNVCYLDSHSTLLGAIGMTHETDGGRFVARRREDDTVLTLRDGIAKHFTAALAVIESASQNRQALLQSFLSHKMKAAAGEHAGKFKRVVATSEDPREIKRFADHLSRTGIQYQWAGQAWKQSDAHDYWSDQHGEQSFPQGALVIDIAQPLGHLAKAWLEPGSDFEPDFISRQKQLAKVRAEGEGDSEIDQFEFYDGTAWCHIYAYNLKAWWCESAPKIATASAPAGKAVASQNSPIGYYLTYTDQEDILFAAKALLAGIKVSMNRRPMKLAGESISRGTFLFLAARNDSSYSAKLVDMARQANVLLKPLTTSYPDEGRYGPGNGENNIFQLKKPNIAIAMGNNGSVSGGPIWYLMEREFKLPFTPLSNSALSGNLDKYSAIVVTSGGASTTGRFGDWVRSGGCAISLSNPGWALGSSGFATLESKSAEPDLPGSFFRAELDPKSFLSYGFTVPAKGPITISVPVSGSNFYAAEEGSAVRLGAGKKLLSGWSWDTTEKDLSGIAWLQDAPAGQGRAVLFMEDPTERAQWPGLYKMLLNAMIIGPSA